VPPAVVEVPELGEHTEEVLLENGYSGTTSGPCRGTVPSKAGRIGCPSEEGLASLGLGRE
jgi:hypothetical protein